MLRQQERDAVIQKEARETVWEEGEGVESTMRVEKV
jgi:hypothetical protein